MLETIREFGTQWLAESGEERTCRDAHAAFFLELAEVAEPHLRRSGQLEWLERLDAERQNLRDALAWTSSTPASASTALRLAAALHWYWVLRGETAEGRRWLEVTLAGASECLVAVRAKALAGLGRIAGRQSDLPAAEAAFSEAMSLCTEGSDTAGLAYATLLYGMAVPMSSGDFRAWADIAGRALQLYREQSDPWGIAAALWASGYAAFQLGEGSASATLAESLDRFRALGDNWGIALAANAVGVVACGRGDLRAAEAYYRECRERSHQLGDRAMVATVLHNQAEVALRRGDFETAERDVVEALALQRELGAIGWMGHCLQRLAAVTAASGRPERAATLAGAAERIAAETGAPAEPVDREVNERHLAGARRAIGEAAYDRARDIGRARATRDAVEEALSTSRRDDAVAGGEVAIAPTGDAVDQGVALRLTRREREVLPWLASGASDQAIADALFISRSTASKHVASLLEKLGSPTRAAAAAAAVRLGLC